MLYTTYHKVIHNACGQIFASVACIARRAFYNMDTRASDLQKKRFIWTNSDEYSVSFGFVELFGFAPKIGNPQTYPQVVDNFLYLQIFNKLSTDLSTKNTCNLWITYI